MAILYGGGPKQPVPTIIISSTNNPLSKGELQRKKKKGRKKNEEPIADTPRYKAKVQREWEARKKEEKAAEESAEKEKKRKKKL